MRISVSSNKLGRTYDWYQRNLSGAPWSNNLCTVVRHVFLMMPLKILLITGNIGIILFGMFVYPWLIGWEHGLAMHSLYVAVVAFFWGKDRWDSRTIGPAKVRQPSVIMAWFRAKKNRYCPTIEWTE
jgi:hypothetical protein